MVKGKYGFFLWLYPLLASLMILFQSSLGALVVLIAAIAIEQNEWVIKQCTRVFLFGCLWFAYSTVSGVLVSLFNRLFSGIIPGVYSVFNSIFSVVHTLITLAYILIVFFLGVVPSAAGKSVGLPFEGLAEKLYGRVKMNPSYPPQGGYPQNPPPQPPYGAPPQNPPTQTPPQG